MISKHCPILVILLFSALILLFGCAVDSSDSAKRTDRRPNVILIMADDLGYETLGCYGGESYDTPVLDRLAETGVRFENAHALPLCTPTRVSLMTGKYNWRNWHSFGILDPEAKTFGHWMTEAGYRTCISGKWQLQSYNPPEFMPEYRGKGQRVEDAGFDEFFLWHAEHTEDKGDRYPDPVINDNCTYLPDTEGKYGPDLYVDYINGFMERNKDEPFFIYYPMALTHGPFQPTPDSPEWPAGRHKNDGRFFHDMVEYMDKMVGRIEAKVAELGLSEDTLIIFYGDNGSPDHARSKMADGSIVPGGKGLNNLRGTHVPLIVSWPGSAASAHVVDDLVDCNDIIPTIFEACGLPLPEGETFDGESLLSQIQGKPGSHRDWLFFHHDPLPGVNKEGRSLQRWAIDRRWKLSEQNGNLYDLIADPEETQPIDVNSAGPQAVAAHKKLQSVIDSMGMDYEPWTWPKG
ncbi:MAG: sulfatase-like hydrolase/transferase [Verrucomicrobia bacterium]|nr:sulfatase-like hydrolase/transferase [Verrucomicrobiota bacterium]